MKSYWRNVAALFTVIVTTVCAVGAEVSPNGTWKWTVQERPGGQGFEQTLRLELKDGKLTGVLLGVKGAQFQVPDTAITEVSFSSDGAVKFAVTRELNGKKFTTRYEGKIVGDMIKGTYERPGAPSAESARREWAAKRQK